jgi:hypothetical protein
MATNDESDRAIPFRLPASVTLREVGPVHAQLAEAVGRHAVEHIDCTGIEDADVTLFQLLAAAKLSAERAGKPLNMIWPQEGRVVAQLRLSGLYERLN